MGASDGSWESNRQGCISVEILVAFSLLSHSDLVDEQRQPAEEYDAEELIYAKAQMYSEAKENSKSDIEFSRLSSFHPGKGISCIPAVPIDVLYALAGNLPLALVSKARGLRLRKPCDKPLADTVSCHVENTVAPNSVYRRTYRLRHS